MTKGKQDEINSSNLGVRISILLTFLGYEYLKKTSFIYVNNNF